MHVPLSLLATALLVAAAPAQGKSIATSIDTAVTTAPGMSSMWSLDHQTRVATQLTISATLAAERGNCVLMTSPVTGYVGTNPLPAPTPGNIFGIVISGTTVVETKLNTTATAGPNVAQMAILGSDLWFVSQNASNVGGILQKMPAGGGAVTTVLDLTTVSGFTGLANSLCVVGSRVYVGAFDSGTAAATPGCLVVYDTATSTGSILATLPQGKFISGTTIFNTGLVHLQRVGTKIWCLGVYGDLLIYDTGGNLLSHVFTGFGTGTAGIANQTNSFDYDPNTVDAIVGSRDGACDRIVGGQSAEKTIVGVGTNVTPTSNSVTGLSHLPAGGPAMDVSYSDAGCAGGSGYRLTDASWGLPASGNASFRVAAYSGSGGDLVACLLAVSQVYPPLDLSIIGMTGCNLAINNIAVNLPGTLSGTGDGNGQVSIPLPIPNVKAVLYRQWAEIQVVKTNSLGVVVSNARVMTIQ